jgi:AraC-like DNA-binding protein
LLLERAKAKKCLHGMRCFAGLVEAVVPVFSGGEHVASLTAGRIFRNHRRERDWERIQKLLSKCPEEHLERLRIAFKAVPVIGGGRVDATFTLLSFFGKTLEEHIPRWLLSNDHPAPAAVEKAKDYILKHMGEHLALPEVAQYAGVSKYYLCELFKRTTGLTFKEYLARLRVEKAKSLLHSNSRRIAEIVFESGFESVPTFNRTFKDMVAASPTQYRRSLTVNPP